jgi:hypothetical protein
VGAAVGLVLGVSGAGAAEPDPVPQPAAVTLALERLAAGGPSLARLAAGLGFAGHAHLTRTVREQLGHTPAQLRRLLRAGWPGRYGSDWWKWKKPPGSYAALTRRRRS